MLIYKFQPTDDITAKELAVIFRTMMTAVIQGISNRPWTPQEDLEIEQAVFKSLPMDSQRHFKSGNEQSDS